MNEESTKAGKLLVRTQGYLFSCVPAFLIPLVPLTRCVAVVTAVLGAWAAMPGPAPAQQWGTIKGQVILAGDKLPVPMLMNVDKDQKHCLENGKLFDPTWAVSAKTKGVRWVFVWLEDAEGGSPPIHPSLKDVPKQKVEIDQPHCLFEPHAMAMRQGQVLVAKNSSPIPHSFKWGGHPLLNPGSNKSMPAKSSFEISDLKADKLPVLVDCTFHPWMHAWVRVFDHPYFAVTDEDGRFEIKLAPAGNFRLKVWHSPGVGWLGGVKGRNGQPVAIQADAVTDVGQLKIVAK
jgi:hypothetical protein